MSEQMLKDKLFVGILLLVFGMFAGSFVFFGSTELERNFFLVAILLFGLPVLVFVAWNWEGLLTRTGYYGFSGERALSMPSSPATRTVVLAAAFGGALGVPIFTLGSFALGVPKDAFFHGLAGFLAGLLLPLGGSLVVAVVLTRVRWSKR